MNKYKLNNLTKHENPNINIALEWIKNNKSLELGIHEIKGRDIFVIVQEYNTKCVEELKWEGHKKYIDIQYILEGEEVIGVSEIKNMEETSEYNDEGDYQFFRGTGESIKLISNEYLLLYPNDIHMPCIGNGDKVMKIVGKVRI